MSDFIKKPVEVVSKPQEKKAMFYDGLNRDAIMKFCPRAQSAVLPDEDWIRVPVGWEFQDLCPGDFLLRDVLGDFEIMKRKHFMALYTPKEMKK